MLKDALFLARNGLAVHWLHPKSKRPIGDDWSDKPVATPEGLESSYRSGNNLGVRLGEPSKVAGLFCHVVDLDVRVDDTAPAALARLKVLFPKIDSHPFVISGSGGSSRHFYLFCDTPFRSKKLAHSGVKFTDAEGKSHWTWEIELFGTGKQVAAPPSIHPDTGLPYRWGREIDFDMLDMGVGPIVTAERLVELTGQQRPTSDAADTEEPDDLSSYVRKAPMDLSDEEVAEILAVLPVKDWCDDRDGWLQVGMALHHQYEGSEKGLKVWNKFSSQSDKFDEKDQRRVWKSFETKLNPVRMATLIQAARVVEIEKMVAEISGDDDGFEDVEEDDDDDLLGPSKPRQETDLLGMPLEKGEKTGKDENWVSKLDLNEEGAIKPTLHNIELIMRNDPRVAGVMRLNEFTQEIVYRGVPGKKLGKSPKGIRQLSGEIWNLRDPVNGDLWADMQDDAVRSIIEAPKRQGGYGIKVSDRDLKASINIVSAENRFHPIREYLDGLVWDGVPRLDGLFTRYLGARDDAYSRAVSRMTILGGVTRIFEPGHKFDFVTILQGLQGKRKSTFIRVLARNWFAELHGDFADRKGMVEQMQGAWVLELPELSSFGKAEIEEIKAFVSAGFDKVRLAYARRAQVFQRQCIFLGSTNQSEFLKDPTGARRFWPIKCEVGEIDTAGLRDEVDQIWAEAVAAYRQMRADQPFGELPLYLADEEARLEAERIQEDRRVESAEDAIAGRITAWLSEPIKDETGFDDVDDLLGAPPQRNETCLIEIWVDCLRNDGSRYNESAARTLGKAIKLVPGWSCIGTRRTVKYGPQRVYRRDGWVGA